MRRKISEWLFAGIATVSLGHCHPKVTAALKAQADQLWHASNVYYTEPQIELAERLTGASFAERVLGMGAGEGGEGGRGGGRYAPSGAGGGSEDREERERAAVGGGAAEETVSV